MMKIHEAARELGVSVVTARKELGTPDKVENTDRNRPRYQSTAEHVQKVKDRLEIKKTVRKGDICRVCHCGYEKDELTGGRCDLCRARFCVLNFCRRNGGCTNCTSLKYGMDCGLLKSLKEAIRKLEGSSSEKKYGKR